MAGVKISDLSTLTPLTTDLIVLDRPSIGTGAPVTGHVTVANLKALIDETGNEYWESSVAGKIFATGTLAAITGSLWSAFLSSSNGGEITGSLLINVEGPNDGHGLIISASTNNSSRALEIVDVANSATIFSVDHNTSKVKVDSIINPNQSIALNAVQGFGAGHIEIKVDTASSPTGSITVIDETSNFSNLNLEIAALEFNGEQGVAGYVLTSSAPNAPGWAPASSLVPVYWQSSVVDIAYTTGSIEATFISGSAGLKVSSSNVEFAFDYNYSNDLSLSDLNSLDEVILTTGSLSYINGTSPTGFAIASAGNIDLNATSNLFVTATTGKMYVAPEAVFDAGLSGSLTQLADGSSYLIAGANVTISTGTNGAVTISSAGGGGSAEQYWFSTVNEAVYTTGSALFSGPGGVGVDSPALLGADMFFFVSGAIGSKDTNVTGTAVFGGDVVISGTLHGGSPLKVGSGLVVTGTTTFSADGGSTSPGLDTAFFVSGTVGSKDSLVAGVASFGGDLHVSGNITSDGNATVSQLISVGQNLQVAGILAVTGSSYLIGSITGSGGLLLTGSAVFAGDGGISVGPDAALFVSGATGANSTNKSVFGGTVHVSGNIQLENGISLQSRNTADQFYVDIVGIANGTGAGLGTDVVVVGDNGNTTGILFQDSAELIALITGSNQGYFSGSYQFPQGISGSLTKLTDGSSYLIAGTNVTISTGTNGAVTISSAGGGGGDQFWFSTVTNESYTTGSVYINAGANGNQNLIKFDVSGSEFSSLGSSLLYPTPGSYIVVNDVPVADASWNAVSGTLNIAAASVMASGSGGAVYIFAGDGGYASGSTPAGGIDGGLISLYPGVGGASDDTAINGGLGGAIGGTGGLGGSGYTVAGDGGFVSFSGGAGGGKSDSNTTDQFTAGTGGAVYLEGGGGGSPFTPGHIDFIGGQGGPVSIAGGIGGSSEGLSNSGGQGGGVTINGGNGGNTTGGGTGGAGGSVIIQPGTPGLDATGQTYNAGNFEVYGGSIPFSSASNNASIARFGVVKTGEIYPDEFKGFNYIIMNDPVDEPSLGGPNGSASTQLDMFFYVSGAIGSKDTLTRGVSIFGGDTLVSGTMNLAGGLRTPPTIVTSLPYTASITDYIIAVSASAGPGVALPSTALDGRNYIVKDVSGSAAADNIVVSVDGGGLIDGVSSYTLSINRGSATFVYFGTSIGWGVI